MDARQRYQEIVTKAGDKYNRMLYDALELYKCFCVWLSYSLIFSVQKGGILNMLIENEVGGLKW
jgi:hypothetical protein